MIQKILLKKNTSKTSLNENSFINIEVGGNKKLFPSTSIDSIVNQYEQYETERKNSNIVRLTCTINPICSNVLFNRVTEIIENEGSSSATCINYQGNNINYVHQSTPSSSDTCTYHCGLDIFNNHFLRGSTFKCIEVSGMNRSDVNTFNTLFDYARNYRGTKKKYYKDNSGVIDTKLTKNYLHLYSMEDVNSFYDTISNKLIEKNGWFGFVNEARMSSNILNDSFINRTILNKKTCQFVDLYPERDLFYFTPKFNKYRHREEKNWNYCLTYPYSSTTENLPFISVITNNLNEKSGVLNIYSMKYDESNSNKISSLKITSLCKHGLKEDDTINIYRITSGISTKLFECVFVNEIIDDYSFYVTQNYAEASVSGSTLAFCKLENGLESKYYVRLFKRIPNWKYADIMPTNYNVNNGKRYIFNKDGKLIENNEGSLLIDCYNNNANDFESHNGALSFARNIYGDEISEIVFTDDIDISYLKDNLGRPLTDLYLTILKNNNGYKEFYGEGNVGSENVEYSHCFGPLTQAFKLCSNAPISASSVTKCSMKNYEYNGLNYNTLNSGVTRLGNEVVYDKDVIFYGDIVCFSELNCEEEIIDESYFRFNTVQRELKSGVFKIKKDDEEEDWSAKTSSNKINIIYKDGLKIKNNKDSVKTFIDVYHCELMADDYDAILPSNDSSTPFFATGKVETETSGYYTGYYYKSHYKIPFKTFSNEISTQQPKKYSVTNITTSEQNNYYIFKTKEFNYLENNDKIVLYNPNDNIYYDFIISKVKDRQTFKAYTDNSSFNDNFESIKNIARIMKVLKIDSTVPEYAKLVKDGSCRYIWREVISNGFDDDSPNETYPFTNGAYYINLPINFYLLRQDSTLSDSKNVYLKDRDENKITSVETNTYYEEGDIVC